MTTINEYIGDAPTVAQVTVVTIVDADPDSPYALRINGKLVEVDGAATPAEIASRLVTAWNESQIAEMAVVTATVQGASVVLTASEPGDPFRVNATRDPNIRVEVITPGSAAVTQRTKITLPSNTDGGTFTITLDFGTPYTTSALAWNATAATVETALLALTGISADDIVVTGEDGGPWTIEVVDDLAGQSCTVTTNTDALTGNATVTFAKIQEAGKDVFEIKYLMTNRYSVSTIDPLVFTYGGNSVATSGLFSESVVQGAMDSLFGDGATVVSVAEDDEAAIVAIAWTDGVAKNSMTVTGGGFFPVVARAVAGGGPSKDQVVLFASSGTGSYTVTVNGETTGSIDGSGDANVIEASLVSELSGLASLVSADFDIIAIQKGASPSSGHVWMMRFTGAKAGTVVTVTTSTGSVTNVNEGGSLQNDVHSVVVNAAGGSFQFDLRGVTSDSIVYGDDPQTFEDEMYGMASANFQDVKVTGSADGTLYIIEYYGTDGGQAWDLPTLTTNALTGGADATVTALQTAVPAVDEVQLITVDEFATAGTFPLQYSGQVTSALDFDATAAEVETALKALDAIGASDVVVTGEDGGPYTVTFASVLSGADVPLIGGIPDGLTISQSAIAVQTTQRSRGPHHFDDPLNWSLGHVLRTDERPTLDRGTNGPRFGTTQLDDFTVLVDDPLTSATETATTRLRLSGGFTEFRVGQTVRLTTTDTLPTGLATATLYYVVSVDVDLGHVVLATTENGAAVSITSAGTGTHTIAVEADGLLTYARHEGEIGLPVINKSGRYREYLSTHLAIGIAAGGVIVIGEGEGSGSGLMRIDTGDYAAEVQVISTSSTTESDAAAFEWIVNNTAATLLIVDGSVAVCWRLGQSGTIGNLTQRAGEIDLGPNLVFASGAVIDKTGGELRSDGATIDGVVKLRG